MKILIILLFSFQTFANKPVWIDYDPGFGKTFLDPDDGLALMHALISRNELEIKGISTVFGNTNNHKHMVRITHKILHKFKTQIPVFRGAWSKDYLGHLSPASEALERELEQGPLTIIAMGRLTNIATVLMKRPELSVNIKELIVNAGRRLEYPTYFGKRKIVFPDTNVDGDSEAFKVLIKRKVNLTMIPVESMKDILWRKQEYKAMKRMGGPIKWIAKKTRIWRWMWKIYPGENGFIPWDLFLVSYLTHRKSFSCSSMNYNLIYRKNDTTRGIGRRNRQAKKFFLMASPSLHDGPMGTYCHKIANGHQEELTKFWSLNY